METHGVLDSFQDGYTVSHLLHCHGKLLYLRKTWCMVENHSRLHEQDALEVWHVTVSSVFICKVKPKVDDWH